jgi:hypothetical protein
MTQTDLPQPEAQAGTGNADIGTPLTELSKLEERMNPVLSDIASIGQTRLLSAEVDLLKGLIGFNGAGIVAVITLTKTSIPLYSLRISMWLFFIGLGFAVAAWLYSMQQWRLVARIKDLLPAMRASLAKTSYANKPVLEIFSTPEEIDALSQMLIRVIHTSKIKLTAPGRRVAWSIFLSGIAFLLAALSLAVSFQFFPINLKP